MSYVFKNLLIVHRDSQHATVEALRDVGEWFQTRKPFQYESPHDLVIVVYSESVGPHDRMIDLDGEDFTERGSFVGTFHIRCDQNAVKIISLSLPAGEGDWCANESGDMNSPKRQRKLGDEQRRLRGIASCLPIIKHVLIDHSRKHLGASKADGRGKCTLWWDSSVLTNIDLLRCVNHAGLVDDLPPAIQVIPLGERSYRFTDRDFEIMPPIPICVRQRKRSRVGWQTSETDVRPEKPKTSFIQGY